MKRNLFVSMLAVCMSAVMFSSCMSMGQMASGSATAPTASGSQQSMVGDVLGSLLGGLIGNAVPVNENNIVGRWVYNSPEVRFESEDFLSKAGGEVAAAQIEKKLADLYANIGIVPGACSFTFNQDKTCSISFGSKNINGTYTVDPAKNTINIVSNTGLIKLNGKVYFGLNSLVLLFEGKKILTVAQTLAAISGGANSSLGTIAGALNQYKGLMLGMNLKK